MLRMCIVNDRICLSQVPPPVRTTLLSAVPVIPRPPVAPVVRLAPSQVLAPMPPMVHAPRINVVQMPPAASHIMAPRPPPMVVPAGEMIRSTRSTATFFYPERSEK